jgi:hypothetical protein
VYFARAGSTVVLLRCGGDKSTQPISSRLSLDRERPSRAFVQKFFAEHVSSADKQMLAEPFQSARVDKALNGTHSEAEGTRTGDAAEAGCRSGCRSGTRRT